MSRRTKVGLVVAVVVLVVGGIAAFQIKKGRNATTEVRLEQVGRLEHGPHIGGEPDEARQVDAGHLDVLLVHDREAAR